MIETLIVPGLNGSGQGHWQREWAERDPASRIVEQQDWSRPLLSEWLHALEAEIESAPGVVLVAHSLGCALVAALAQRPAASHIAGALLVAPADLNSLSNNVPSIEAFDRHSRARLPFPSILVASRNDPFMTFDGAGAHAARWGSALVDIGHAGHVNVASGFGHWPDGFVLADGLRGRVPARAPQPSASGTPTPWNRQASFHLAHDSGLGIN